MTLRIEIQEQPERARYWAEVEVGGMIARRREVMSPKADGLSGILAAVYAAAAEMDPRIPPPPQMLSPSEFNDAARGELGAAKERADAILAEDGALDALRAEAEAAGVRLDRRWGEARIRQEIALTAERRRVIDGASPSPPSSDAL